MSHIIFRTECENCGGDAYMSTIGSTNEVIIEFLEETPFMCVSCAKETYLTIEKN